ncbi:MAG: hypothetical protein U5K37_10500 [Natrialbaceae archaeon]|nr:hypothetical protein [Natrialbaceae archaeon]
MAAVADDWTTVATILYRASERPTLPEMEPDLSEAADMIATIADREAAIYESLRDSR